MPLPSNQPQNGQEASDDHTDPDYHVARTAEGESAALPSRADDFQIRSQGKQRKRVKIIGGN
jgi:hypothetical protein